MNRFFERLFGDRGEGDPLLTIVSAVASVVVSAAIIGAILQVVGLGSRFVEEQTTMSLAGQAQKLWSADAQNATGVSVYDSSRVTFTESDAKTAPITIARGPKIVGCRVSVWDLKGGKLTDTVYTVGSDCIVRDGEPETPLITLPGVVSGAMNFTNASGRTLTFVAGKAATAVANPSTYWNNTEWKSVIPKKLNFKSKLRLPLTKVDRDFTMFGVAHLGEDHGLLPSSGIEAPPSNVIYTPAKPAVTLKQSTTVGTSYAGQREGIDVAWSGVTCGPYSVKYTVTWTPTTAGATAKTYTVTAYDKTYSTKFPGVPNGAHGSVTVLAQCPGAPPPSATGVVTRTPVKLPALTITAKATTPVSHTISWKPVSSLRTTYDVQVSVDGAAYVSKAKWTAPANAQPTVDVSRAIPAAATGQSYGRSYRYRVVASVGEAESVTSNVATLSIQWPATPAVKVSATESGLVSWNAATCAPGTTNQYQYRTSVNGTWSAWSGWVLTKTVTRALNQGAQVGVEARAHCSNPFSASATTSNGPVYAVKKISTAPSTTATASTNGGGSWTSVGCPAGTAYRYQYRTMTNGAWSGWFAFTTARSVGKTTNQGASTGISARARCVSNYTEGPVGGKNDKTTAKPISTIPSAPWLSVPGSAAVGNYFGISAGPQGTRCPAGTSARYTITNNWSGTVIVRNAGPNGSVSASDYWNSSGYVTYYVTAYCYSNYISGRASGRGAAGINIYVPAPGRPGGVSASFTRGSTGGGSISLSFGGASNATGYEFGGRIVTVGGVDTGWTDYTGGSGTYTVNTACGAGSVVSAQARVRAYNGGGYSAWVYVDAIANGRVMTCL